jgi:hypothetical protein
MKSTLVAVMMIRNVSFQDVLKFEKFATSRLTWLAALIALVVVCGAPCHAQSHPYLTKEFFTIYQRLQAPWEQQFDNTLAESYLAISSAYGVTIWIDPSLPRDKQISVDSSKALLADMLDETADAVNGAIVPIEGMILVVPKDRADAIRTQYWKNRTSRAGNVWSKMEATAFEWESGAPTKTIASNFARRFKLNTKWIDELESDLWPAFTFPKQSPLAIATCLFSGMERSLDLNATPPVVVPLQGSEKSDHRVGWKYTKEQIKLLGTNHCKAWKAKNPSAEINEEAGQWTIVAKPSEHLDLVKPLIPKVTYQIPTIENSKFQGELQGTLGNILASVAKQTKLEFVPWPLPDAVGKRDVKVKYNNATIDKLLEELGKAGRVKFKRQGMKCEIEILDP